MFSLIGWCKPYLLMTLRLVNTTLSPLIPEVKKCDKCDMSYARSGSLARHKRTHTDESRKRKRTKDSKKKPNKRGRK